MVSSDKRRKLDHRFVSVASLLICFVPKFEIQWHVQFFRDYVGYSIFRNRFRFVTVRIRSTKKQSYSLFFWVGGILFTAFSISPPTTTKGTLSTPSGLVVDEGNLVWELEFWDSIVKELEYKIQRKIIRCKEADRQSSQRREDSDKISLEEKKLVFIGVGKSSLVYLTTNRRVPRARCTKWKIPASL